MNIQQATEFRCATAEDATLMVRLLLGSGDVRPGDVEVISTEPIPEIESLIAGKSRLPVFVITGALLGIVAGFLLASRTAELYPINTGGMPIVSLLPVGIVTYETMMLFAVLFSFAGLLFEARLPRRRPADAHSSAPDDGEILVLARVGYLKKADALRASNANHGP